MGKVITLGHKLIEREFEETIASLTQEFAQLNEQDPNYHNLSQQIKDKYADQFFAFRKKILDLGYGKEHVCECLQCKNGLNNVVPKMPQ